jgi:hypothetical protein
MKKLTAYDCIFFCGCIFACGLLMLIIGKPVVYEGSRFVVSIILTVIGLVILLVTTFAAYFLAKYSE